MFSALPKTLYFLLVASILVALCAFAFKTRKNNSMLITVGLLLSAFGPITAIYAKGAQFFGGNAMLQKLFSYLTILGFILLLIGGYRRIEADPKKKRTFLVILFALIIFPLLVVAYLYYSAGLLKFPNL